MKFTILLIAVLFQLCFAQQYKEPFSSIDIRGGLLINSNRNLLHQYWKPGKGFFISADSPFYFGNIEAGIFYIPFKSLTFEIPDYKNYFFFLGFNKAVTLPFNVSFKSGLKLGSSFFKFADDSLTAYESIESEIGIDFFASLKLQFYEGFHLNTSIDYLGIITNRKIQLLFLSAGIGYEFSTPLWMREFLN